MNLRMSKHDCLSDKMVDEARFKRMQNLDMLSMQVFTDSGWQSRRHHEYQVQIYGLAYHKIMDSLSLLIEDAIDLIAVSSVECEFVACNIDFTVTVEDSLSSNMATGIA